MQKQTQKASVLIILIVLVVLAFYYFDFTPASFQEWVESFGVLAGVIFVLIYAIGPVIFIPGSILSLTAGALFGKAFGTLYVLIGANIAANIAFSIARYFRGEKESTTEEQGLKKRLQDLDEKVGKNGFVAVLATRIIPFPFILLNYAWGFTRVRHSEYFFGTLLGMIPGIFALVYLGEGITNPGSTNFWLALLVFGIVIALSAFCKKYIQKEKNVKI